MRLVFMVVAFLFCGLLNGCVPSINMQLNPIIPEHSENARLPLKAALYIPESTRIFLDGDTVPTMCNTFHFKADYGRTFSKTVEGTMDGLFREMTVVDSPLIPPGFDILLVATIESFKFKPGCASGDSWVSIEGSFKATKTNGSAWASSKTLHKDQYPWSISKAPELNYSIQISRTMANLAKEWSDELSNSLKQQQVKKRKFH